MDGINGIESAIAICVLLPKCTVLLRSTRTYMEAVRKIGFTITSILAAISSAGMRLGVLCRRRAVPKMAQAAVVASRLGSVPDASRASRHLP
jgi:hypothetical protein